MLAGLVASGCVDANSGRLVVLTYNVAGLPEGLSSSQPERFIPLISPKLNTYPLVLVQEDFYYHAQLQSQVGHPFRSTPQVAELDLFNLGDGLNRFGARSFREHGRETWAVCNGTFGNANDCLTTKGFSFALHELAPGVEIGVYNLHMDAGGSAEDIAARSAQGDQLIAHINSWATGRALIVAGDTNLQERRPTDMETLARILGSAGLTDSCRHLRCGDERIDRVLFRGAGQLHLEAERWSVPTEFVSEGGEDLSDHEPVAVTLRWFVGS